MQCMAKPKGKAYIIKKKFEKYIAGSNGTAAESGEIQERAKLFRLNNLHQPATTK